VSAMEYADYLRTRHWQALRARYRASGLPWRCARCGWTGKLDLHHRTYERLGRERLTDLEPLCRHCHDREHGK
jgi:5-methylcytosine-specific restriction endonuclease McrA